MTQKILTVNHVSKTFIETSLGGLLTKKMPINVVNNITFYINTGEICAIVGESGCGKSTLAKMIVGLLHPDEGSINFKGVNLCPLSQRQFRVLRPSIQMISQNPFDCFNPRKKMSTSLLEGMTIHRILENKSERITFINQLLNECHLGDIDLNKYPHAFSGGQLQRLSIVRALSLKPQLIIADEVLSALDIPIQQQVAELFKTLKQKYRLSMLFISHDLAVVRKIADHILVMHNGEIVESNSPEKLFCHPQHEFTRQLLNSMINLTF